MTTSRSQGAARGGSRRNSSLGRLRSFGRRVARRLARAALRFTGWELDDRLPPTDRYVIIGAPHTSNWDLPLALLAMTALDIRGRWTGKHTLFRGPAGPIMRALGGVPVNRGVRQNLVSQVARQMRSSPGFRLVVTPEGTRSPAPRWKTGFYYIALEADVPIAFGYADFASRRVGVGGWLRPSGELEADMQVIRDFYADKVGKRPEKKGPVRVRAP